ncbi:citrate synthase/methylcitrate synthase [Halomarina rubra]|uniref:Citrate synthase n=1 Tax=Halomarina rubra TaxID=2071873 RepID=A0ABD6B107_9EURY|nr:citrate synthase/methylcitrate synthase [Halomarina rubra]
MEDSDLSFDPGLEHVLAGETRLSTIDGEAGELVIGGFPLEELAPNATYEEALYLLWNDRLPTEEELSTFRSDLAAHRDLSDGALAAIREAAERRDDAMDAERIGAACASLARPAEEDTDGEVTTHERDAMVAVAQLPTAVAAYWRVANGEEPVAPRDDLTHAANYLWMLTGEEPTDEQVRGLETYLCSVIDHGFNASTYTARVVASTESDVLSAVTGAVGALKGPLHGGAPGPVLDMLEEIADHGDPQTWLTDRLDAGERLMGFGHRVYRVRDPRAAVLSEAAEEFYAGEESAFFDLARDVESAAVSVLDERKPGRSLETNVEFYTAVLLRGVGVPRELFSATFGVSRVGGWTAHCLEQYADNRIVRPRSRYVGETGRTWTPVGER